MTKLEFESINGLEQDKKGPYLQKQHKNMMFIGAYFETKSTKDFKKFIKDQPIYSSFSVLQYYGI